ncbi:GTPase-associated protein 1-related protein [Streptomyces sp. AC555_RSS877]|uniref:GTPase-associated protein 1-related protein n=1 Tax=Streptomyces sp. AC555_RSS877 TaxID=2823688 RepID=UPI001C26AACF|nr:GTPase-associated protein 1-related protein [Streptomyces sp. AC555_RSS877]
MSLAQLHYTSAPPGPDGSGFRFTAVSAGVPQGLLREAEQLIGYEPPRDLPARPDAEQLKSFPKALTFSELADGGRLLSRSVYTGADYSGRWGNFHAHAFHLPAGARLPDGALPVTAWESPRWADATPPGGRPEPVDRIEPSGMFRTESLVAFAVSRADRLAPFFADLRALTTGQDAGQIVLVEQDSADVAQWLALACTVLPREQAHGLTFTTYTRRPQQARQQIVGALPSSESVAHDHRFRVHDCTARPPSQPVTDVWADLCARIWCAGRPDLFRDAGDDLGGLAVAALAAGIALRGDARTTAARWATAHADTSADGNLAALVAGLCAGTGAEPGTVRPRDAGYGRDDVRHRADGRDDLRHRADGPHRETAAAHRPGSAPPAPATPPFPSAPPRPAALPHPGAAARAPRSVAAAASTVDAAVPDPADDEQSALAALLARIEGQVPTTVSAPLAARVLSSAVLGRGPVPALGGGSLTPQTRTALARDLAPALRSGIADTGEPAAGRPLALLHVADLLDVDCQDLLPHLAGRLARGLVDEERPDGRGTVAVPAPPALLDAVHGHPALRIALFGALDALAAADPPAVARTLSGSELPVAPAPHSPHLRMCVTASGADDGPGSDRLARFHAVLRTAGVSPHADTTVLRTALRLVWDDELPTGQEASLLLNQLGSDIHRSAGTRDQLIEAALAAPADDPGVPDLATDLLRCFSTELRPGQRAALLLLEFAGLLGTEGEGEQWVDRVLALRDSATEPVPDPVTERVYRALARRLLSGTAPENEVYSLARSAEPAMLAAYERAGRSDRVGDRLRTVPAYVAARFCDWSAYPGTHPSWDATRTTLLTKVLRPIVRALPAEDHAEIETALGKAGRGKLDAFRSWNRPGALGRLAGRLSGRGRGGEPPPGWTGDVEPPAEGGRR